jgi:hypothetical protein
MAKEHKRVRAKDRKGKDLDSSKISFMHADVPIARNVTIIITLGWP